MSPLPRPPQGFQMSVASGPKPGVVLAPPSRTQNQDPVPTIEENLADFILASNIKWDRLWGTLADLEGRLQTIEKTRRGADSENEDCGPGPNGWSIAGWVIFALLMILLIIGCGLLCSKMDRTE